MIGQTISHYTILEKLGEGGMGVVYKAQDTRLNRTVALKFLPRELTRDHEAKQRFVLEAQAASALQHNNICSIHDIDASGDGQTFIVMDCYEGETLKQKIGHGPLKIDDAVDLAVQVAQGLQKAHSHNIAHRDVKPANVIITNDGVAKILDFGIAKLAGQTLLTKAGATVGTLPYMSPEQARGDKVDQRTDIWSLGAVLYEMVTGQLPFKSEYHDAVVYSILNESPQPVTGLRTGVPLALERLIEKCLEKKASDRYQHMDELMVDLRKVILKTATQIGPPRRRLKPLWIAVPIALLSFIGLYFLLFQKTEVRGKSIAVLPFQNLSAEGPHAYFADGLHDELLTQLSKVAALTVISRTSVMGYANTKTSLRQIASELGVKNVVEGSVQVVGDRLRVNVQLIDAATDAPLWAEHYDRTMEDAFAVQSNIAQHVVEAVGAALSGTERQGLAAAPTANAEAYRLYLQGREYLLRPGFVRQNLESAQQLFERALSLDSAFALAHAALSQVHGFIYWWRYDPLPARATIQREEAEAALRIAPELPQGHVAMGLAHYYGRRDYQKALEEFAFALKGMPNDAETWANVGAVQRRLGNWKEAIAMFEKAMRLNPRDANLFYNSGGMAYFVMHRYAEAVRSFDHALSLAPDLHVAAVRKGRAYFLWQGQLDTLRATLSRVPWGADLGTLGTRADEHVELLYWERQADSLLQFIRMTPVTVFKGQIFFLPAPLYTAWAHELRGEHLAARTAFHSALAFLDSVIKKLPDDWRVHAARGLALAGLTRRDEALHETSWLQQSVVYHEDAVWGPILAEYRARILAQVGEAGSALDEIEKLLAEPSHFSVYKMRLDPLWDPIRGESRFKALAAKYIEH